MPVTAHGLLQGGFQRGDVRAPAHEEGIREDVLLPPLHADWPGRVEFNPPRAKELPAFVEKLFKESVNAEAKLKFKFLRRHCCC